MKNIIEKINKAKEKAKKKRKEIVQQHPEFAEYYRELEKRDRANQYKAV